MPTARIEDIESEAPVSPEQEVIPEVASTEEDEAGETHDWSSTQLNLPDDLATAILQYGSAIPPDLLSGAEGEGEQSPHVTVLYGIDSPAPDIVSKSLADQQPVVIKIGKLSLFGRKLTTRTQYVIGCNDVFHSGSVCKCCGCAERQDKGSLHCLWSASPATDAGYICTSGATGSTAKRVENSGTGNDAAANAISRGITTISVTKHCYRLCKLWTHRNLQRSPFRHSGASRDSSAGGAPWLTTISQYLIPFHKVALSILSMGKGGQ